MKTCAMLALAAMISLATFTAPAMAWEPTKEVEFVVPSAPGGGSDLNARTIADIAQVEKFSPTNLMVVNKPGGSGAVAFSYVGSKRGNDNLLMVLHNGQAFGSYVLNWDVKTENLTYIGTVAYDPQMLCAVAGSRFTDLKAAIELSKKERVTYGGSNKGNTDHLSFLTLNKETGSKFKYVMFNSSGEVAAAMLGGHVDLGVLNPSECIGQIRAGKLVPLAIYSEERETGELANVPTAKELGFPKLIITDVRSIAGPPDMKPEAVAFYEKMLENVTKTERWQNEYIKKNFLLPAYLNAAQTRTYFENEAKVALERFKEDTPS